ncbi:hypothetical protein M885DRAFT_540553 [Pelagophyceae sp. CCMP2097]|nr:hypothetical protein M885DRAFT_540553 [Pelagophyceae sp. CCMP2097]
MYTSKFMNKNVTVDNKRYITINDPYVGTKEKLPARWKEKQFHVQQEPHNAGDGYFGYDKKPFTYHPEPFLEQRPYLKQQPPDKRKLGFGTHDAHRRDEFSQTIRTEQYRETLKKETWMEESRRDPDALSKAVEAETARSQTRTFVSDKKEITHLYDVGRTIYTEFNPKNGRDQFYSIKHAYHRDKRMGNERTASQEVGESAWDFKYQKPEHSAPSQVKNFFDKSHLGSPGS